MSNPSTDYYWHALERIMRYLVGTMSYGIYYSRHPAVLEGYSDSNWISDADEFYAMSGYVFTLGGGVISWRSCKQTILTRSTMEAELTALDTAIVEAEWLCELLMDLPVVEKPVPAILMNCDNQTVIVKVNSAKDNAKSSRHIKRRLKSIRKMRNRSNKCNLYSNRQKPGRSLYKRAITECDRRCIEGYGFETHINNLSVFTKNQYNLS